MGWTDMRGNHWPSLSAAQRADKRAREVVENEEAAREAQEKSRRQAKRMDLADKIVMAVVDQVCAAIIRPGPKPEERECYVVAQELRDFSTNLRDMVTEILKIEAEE